MLGGNFSLQKDLNWVMIDDSCGHFENESYAFETVINDADVIFLRKTFGMSLKDWSAEFGLSAAGVLKKK